MVLAGWGSSAHGGKSILIKASKDGLSHALQLDKTCKLHWCFGKLCLGST